MRALIRDNGGRPFMITDDFIHPGKVLIYANNGLASDEDVSEGEYMVSNFTDPPILEISDAIKVFVSSEWNTMWDKYDDDMGGSFLVQIRDTEISTEYGVYAICNYVFVGHEIFSFSTYYPIIEFFSPVGNNDVPYPSAKDINDRQYLFLEKIVISPLPPGFSSADPYEYYYFGGRYHNTLDFKLWQGTFPKAPLMTFKRLV